MTLSSVLDQMSKLPVPHTKEQEEDDVFSFCRCCGDLMDFIRPFVQEVKTKSERSEKTPERQDQDEEDELKTELLKL